MRLTGLFCLFLLASSCFLKAQEGQEAQSRLLPLELPQEWTLFCPESSDGLDLESLNSIPAALHDAPGRRVRFDDYAFSVDRGLTKSGPAIFMYEFDSDHEGLMQAGGGADWFWNLTINGQPVLDRLKSGNQAGPITHRNHTFYLPVKKGRNIVVAKVLRGSNGWKFAYGPVPFTVLENGIISQPGLASTDCVITGADGKALTQTGTLRDAVLEGRGKDFTLRGALTDQIRLVLRSQEIRTKAGHYAIELSYTLESEQPLDLQGAEAVLRFTPDFAAGAVVKLADREVPAAQAPALSAELKSVSVSGAAHRIVCAAETPLLALRNSAGLEVAAIFPDLRGTTSATVTYRIECSAPPFEITSGKDWAPLPLERTVEKDSILDFSFVADRHTPAGRLGRILPGPEGRFVYEKTGERARLIGANLCFDANYIPKEESDALAEVFRRQGYNSVRFHHTDIHMIKGAWNAHNSYEIEPQMLDRLDYLFFAMKRAGMYITIDLYTMRYFGPGEIEGIDKRISGDIKQLLPVSDSAFSAWSKLVLAWMNHVNPYTGIAWKDDPALTFICPLNEDAIFSVLSDNSYAMELFRERYEAWKTENGITGADAVPLKKDSRFTRFAIETKRASNRKIAAFFKENGINIPLTGSNWWNTQAQTFTRAEFDVVDNHQYADHPSNDSYNQSSCLKGDPSRTVPVFMMPTRIFGKPFTVTEFNYCFPNQYRAEGGALFGAYSALQDWDAVYRFAWSHGQDKNLGIHPVSHFDISSDLLSLYADRQIALLFARGDVSPAAQKYLYAVTMREATKEGFGGMWAGGLFPAGFSALGLVSQIGSLPLLDGGALRDGFAGICADTPPAQSVLGDNKFITPAELAGLAAPNAAGEIVSDTGEIRLNPTKGYLLVVTPKTECVVAFPENELTGQHLSVRGLDTFSAVSASAMDGQTLGESTRILVFHLTNVLNSGMKFSNAEMRRIEETGRLPHLVRCGKAEITLHNTNSGLKVYAVDSAGRRVRTVDVVYKDGSYSFRAEIMAGGPEAVMAYEIAP